MPRAVDCVNIPMNIVSISKTKNFVILLVMLMICAVICTVLTICYIVDRQCCFINFM